MRRRKDKDGTTVLEGGALTVSTALTYFYPVGSVIMTTDNTNPNTRFGFSGTTWVAFGAGRAVVGVGNNGTNTYTSEQTFGADTCTLTAAQCGVNSHTHASGGNTAGVSATHSHLIPNPLTMLASNNAGGVASDNGGQSVVQGATSGRFAHTVDPTGGSRTTTTDSPDHAHSVPATGAVAGPGTPTAHDIRQTSIAVYLWKRTV